MISYKEAGVDIAAGNEAVKRFKSFVEQTFSPYVYSDIGSFGSAFDLKALLHDYEHPLLVQSIDGVGTKTLVASQMQKFDTLGIDLVSATANDIIVMGATPITLLDYIATQRLTPSIVEEIVKGMAFACEEHGISLVGGETAEMPGVYQSNEYDLAGCITGVVERSALINGKHIKPGDCVYGLASNGLHTNGFSLARKVCFEVAGWKVDTYLDELQSTVGECLLTPHLNYTRPILHCLQQNIAIKGMAHITGGGLLENIPRILPQGCQIELHKRAWPVLPIFNLMQQVADIPDEEMYRTFNMGIGLVIVLNPNEQDKLIDALQAFSNYTLYSIGNVVCGDHKEIRIL